ncbi:MAG: choice-of-anchor tandem repeat GloVer-containing protein [Candidatus Korobacteraceae bacterium]
MTTRPGCAFHLPLSAFALAMLCLLTMLATAPALAQTYTILHAFTGGADGWDPFGLTISSSGTIYGTTWNGGNGSCRYYQCGTVFELSHRSSGWNFKSLYSFTQDDGVGYYPEAPVTVGPNGALYGTTTSGGSAGKGAVFELQPPAGACKNAVCYWTPTVIHAFQGGLYDGDTPWYETLIFDQAGNIYGTTGSGGATNNGVVYELTPSGSGWSVSLLHSFLDNGVDGYDPRFGVVFDPAGNLYGTTAQGGTGTFGTIFELTPSGGTWAESILHDFNLDNGSVPENLIMDQSSNLYGVATGYGTPIPANVFELTQSDGSWTFYNVQIVQNCTPGSGVVRDAAGNFYGSCDSNGAHGYGWIFELTNSGNVLDLHDFDFSDGYEPGGLALDASGNLYGIAGAGGYNNNGLVWEITGLNNPR